jgi:acetylornithine deacetylase
VRDDGGVEGVGRAGVEHGFELAGGAAEVVDGLDHGVSVTAATRRVMLEAMPIDPIQLTRQLVDIESTTYHEAPAGEFLAELLAGLGYAIERQQVPQPDPAKTPGGGSGERFNVYACEVGVTPDLVFSTHMDTVPPFLGPCREDEEFLYGRGTCDAKGIIAAQIAAAERLLAEGLKVGLLLVVGEERDSAGAKVANENARGSRFLINGEPTDNRLALASKGCLRVELRAHGKMAHSAYPELGESAIDKLLAALHDVQALELPVVEGIGESTLNVGLIQGGRAPNVIADKAEAHILVRLVGPATETRAAIVKAVAGRADVEFSLELPFVRMRAIEGMQTMVAKFTTDIPSLTNWGEPFLLGPGSIHVAHTPDECVRKSELLECVELYVKLAKRLVAGE